MKLAQPCAVLAALSVASYAIAAPPEAAQLGRRLDFDGQRPASGSRVELPNLPETSGVRIGRALNALKPETRAATRGSAETRVYQQASPSVVLIVTDEMLGSGAVISADGQIITNLHVVGDAEEVGVVFKPRVEGTPVAEGDVVAAKVLRRDEVADLALIQVAKLPDGVKPLEIGNSTTLEVGADVHAIGHPTGQSWTYTRGIVSQIRRAYAWTTESKLNHEATVIQTQTPINPGNSGGPLLDDQLRIVGINSFVGEGEGLNFAVSAEDVKSFLARSQDRFAAKQAAACTEDTVLEERPLTKTKGVEQLLDTDCDGEGDTILATPRSKREPVTATFDDDGDGLFDTVFIDYDRDGEVDEALYDTDANGKPDLFGEFRKGEDEPYRLTKMKEDE